MESVTNQPLEQLIAEIGGPLGLDPVHVPILAKLWAAEYDVIPIGVVRESVTSRLRDDPAYRIFTDRPAPAPPEPAPQEGSHEAWAAGFRARMAAGRNGDLVSRPREPEPEQAAVPFDDFAKEFRRRREVQSDPRLNYFPS